MEERSELKKINKNIPHHGGLLESIPSVTEWEAGIHPGQFVR